MIPVAVGAAWAMQLDGRPNVAVTFFGDGAVEEGVWYESLNLAAVHALPVLFVAEANQYATHSALAVRQHPGTTVVGRAAAIGVDGRSVDGRDPSIVAARARAAVARCRVGDGPFLLEISTYRYREHVGPLYDWDRGYRTEAEGRAWMARDPICALPDEPSDVAEIQAAIIAAEAAPFPEVTWTH
jgi:pyruvate dehydrogenase E1 component alpha subunit